MSQSWIEITLEVDKAEAEDWADALLEAGALSVQAEDADADSPDEQPLFGEPVPPGLPGTIYKLNLTQADIATPAVHQHPAQGLINS